MLLAGGVLKREYATLVFALPVTAIACWVMASFYRALRTDGAERGGPVLRRPSMAASGGHVPERSWTQQLGQRLAVPSRRDATRCLDHTGRPALGDVAAQFRSQGHEIERGDMTRANGHAGPLLRVVRLVLRAFHCQVDIVQAPAPTFSGKVLRETDFG